jgi:hypothetical protein
MFVRLFALLLALLVAGCATGPQARYATPSGLPEAMFTDSTLRDVNGVLQNACMRGGLPVVQATDYNVRCQLRLNAMQQTVIQMGIGNSYSTTPVGFVDFALAPLGGDVRVSARTFAQTQMAFGQVNSVELNNAAMLNGVMDMMMQAGGRFTPGTRWIEPTPPEAAN